MDTYYIYSSMSNLSWWSCCTSDVRAQIARKGRSWQQLHDLYVNTYHIHSVMSCPRYIPWSWDSSGDIIHFSRWWSQEADDWAKERKGIVNPPLSSGSHWHDVSKMKPTPATSDSPFGAELPLKTQQDFIVLPTALVGHLVTGPDDIWFSISQPYGWMFAQDWN